MKKEAVVVESEQNVEVGPGVQASAVDVSRSLAVDRVFKGGATAVLGYGLTLGASALEVALGIPPLITIGASAAVIGLGLAWAGRGAKHLLQYGRGGSALGLLSATGLGGSILLSVSTRALLELTAHPFLSGLNQISMVASGLFTALVLIQVIVALVGWLLPDSETEELGNGLAEVE